MDGNAFSTAYALSVVAGLRPFAMLAVASLAMHFGWVHPAHAYAGLGSDGASVVLLVLAVVELCADKIPGIDHVLHVLSFATKPVAAAILVGSALPPDLSPGVADGGVALAAFNALALHSGTTIVRGGSSAITLGMANPVISFVEDALSAIMLVLAVAAPFVGAAFALLVTLVLAAVAVIAIRALLNRRALAG